MTNLLAQCWIINRCYGYSIAIISSRRARMRHCRVGRSSCVLHRCVPYRVNTCGALSALVKGHQSSMEPVGNSVGLSFKRLLAPIPPRHSRYQ
eukprot:2717350-Amphidinium_carterae.1